MTPFSPCVNFYDAAVCHGTRRGILVLAAAISHAIMPCCIHMRKIMIMHRFSFSLFLENIYFYIIALIELGNNG